MFSYYGSKSKIVDLYPPPKHKRLIEPFAGSARYSLRYFERDILLIDKYEVVVTVWKYLQKCSPKDILGLPEFKKALNISSMSISEEEKMFLGLLAGVASTSPRNKVSAFSAEQNGLKNRMKRIANSLYKIKHWEVRLDTYKNISNEKATWFIDPPYQFGGHAYVENNIDFQELSTWIKVRNGQTIVCENTKATWMDFKPMARMRGGNGKHTTEAIWSNEPTAFDYQQQSLFI